MNRNTRTRYTTIGAAILAFAAGTTFASAPEPTSVSQQRSITAAISALALQPGDEQLIGQAVSNPMVFTEAAEQRLFTGQLIVHAKAKKVRTANARVSPIVLKSSDFVDEYVIDVPAGMTEGELAAILMATGDYEFVEPNWLRFPAATTPNDSQFNSSWQHNRLQSTAAWDLNTGSSDVIVAVCDSGVDLDHADLVDSLVPGFNAASRRAQDIGGDVDDINGHGTFVAGCAAARGNNNRGVVGVGWNFSIMPIRVTNNTNGTASSFDILEGARWAAENGAQIVNASFSGGTSASNNSAGTYLKTLGSLLFWSSGNDGAFIDPNRPNIVIVGSTTSSDFRSGFSNFGPAVDVTAPGSSVRSTRRGGSYGNSSGTSYASPIAAGVGAMIYSVNPEFSGDDVQEILYNSVDDLGVAGRDDSYGRGRVNTHNAILVAQSYERPTEAPFNESFESNDWQDLLVATSGSVQITSPVDAPNGTSVIELNNTDTIETVRLAGRSLGYDDSILSFMLKSSSIEAGESLTIQYLENPEVAADTWTTVATITGQGLTSDEFVAYDFELPNDYEWHGVKIRFVANGSDSSDTWMIDSLAIDVLPASSAPLNDHFETGAYSSARWSDVDDATIGFEDDNFFAQLEDAHALESRNIPLDQFGIVPAYIRFDAWSDGNTNAGDKLLVEVRNIVGDWIPAGTIDADELTSQPQLIELDVPVTAIAIADMRVRVTASTAGAGAFRIDNVYVGIEELSGSCSGADLAEPYGLLNFFDISAYLSAFSAGETQADMNDDGLLNFFDISEYLNVFGAGCP